jgi:hypothetical protein
MIDACLNFILRDRVLKLRGWRESCSQCSIDEDLLVLRFHEAFRRLRSLGSIDGRLLPRQRRDGVRKQLRAKSVSILQSEVLGPVRSGL